MTPCVVVYLEENVHQIVDVPVMSKRDVWKPKKNAKPTVIKRKLRKLLEKDKLKEPKSFEWNFGGIW